MVEVMKISLENEGSSMMKESVAGGRAMPEITAVACHKIPDIAILSQNKKLLDLNVVRQHFVHEGRLTTAQIIKILNDSDRILKAESNLVEINKMAYVFGDFHGQFYDLVAVLDTFDLSKDTLVFLGDYVDRGSFGCETYLYLMLLKTHYPNNIYLLRGNHESRKMTSYFTFKSECLYKYSEEVYERFVKSFDVLPYAALIQSKAFCCHGGLSPHLKYVRDLNKFNRFGETESEGVLCDLLWSDPHPYRYNSNADEWNFNYNRNCSYFYSYKNVTKFLKENSLSVIIRGHEVQKEGYMLYDDYDGHPSVITVFSAPNYCDTYINKGAYVEFDGEAKSISQFCGVPHPYVIGGFLDGIGWSLPFVSQKVLEFGIELFRKLWNIDIVEDSEKVLARMTILRFEREKIDEFEEVTGDCDSTVLGVVNPHEGRFEELKMLDAINECSKELCENENISIDLSPSQKSEIIADIAKLNLDDAIETNVISVSETGNQMESIELNLDAGRTEKKKGLFRYFF